MKVALGTWGFYKDNSSEDIEEVLKHAIKRGVYNFDTALVYGNQAAEKVIGKICKQHNNLLIRVTTKIPGKIKPYEGCCMKDIYDVDWMHRCLECSINNLGNIDTILLHNWSTEFKTNEFEPVLNCLKEFKNKGLCNNIGVSLPNGYGVMPQDAVVDACDVFMLPYNEKNDWGKTVGLKLKESSKKIMIRSIFLSGQSVPESETLKRKIVSSAAFADEIVFGTTSRVHLDELLEMI